MEYGLAALVGYLLRRDPGRAARRAPARRRPAPDGRRQPRGLERARAARRRAGRWPAFVGRRRRRRFVAGRVGPSRSAYWWRRTRPWRRRWSATPSRCCARLPRRQVGHVLRRRRLRAVAARRAGLRLRRLRRGHARARRFAWGARAGVFAFPLVQLATDPVAHVAATGALMTLIGVLFLARRRSRARASAARGRSADQREPDGGRAGPRAATASTAAPRRA